MTVDLHEFLDNLNKAPLKDISYDESNQYSLIDSDDLWIDFDGVSPLSTVDTITLWENNSEIHYVEFRNSPVGNIVSKGQWCAPLLKKFASSAEELKHHCAAQCEQLKCRNYLVISQIKNADPISTLELMRLGDKYPDLQILFEKNFIMNYKTKVNNG